MNILDSFSSGAIKMDSNENIYRLNQGDKEYILTPNIIGNAIRITCKNILNEKQNFQEDFTIDELERIDQVFNFIETPFQGLDYINKDVKSQKIGIAEEDHSIKIYVYMTFPGISHQLEISLGVQTYLPLVLIAHFQKILRQQHPL